MAIENVGAVITAAGQSTRMGQNKIMLRTGSRSVIQQIVFTLQKAGVSPIVIVTGYQADLLRDHMAGWPVEFVHNPRYADSGMFSSAKAGFAGIQGRCAKLFFTPADIPMFAVDTVRALLRESADIVQPSYNGKKGHPILLRETLLAQFLKDSGDGGLREAIRRSGCNVKVISVEDCAILLDIDTPEDYHCLLRDHVKGALY